MEYAKLNKLLSQKKLGLCERYEQTKDKKFICYLRVLKDEFSGTGPSKKKAKLEAITNILPHIEGIDISQCTYLRTKFKDLRDKPCRLLEYVMECRKEASPKYVMSKDKMGWFHCELHVTCFDTPYHGVGATIKESRENAALKMLDDCQIGEKEG